YRLQGLVSFYPHFRTLPPPRVEVNICRDAACWLAGGEQWSVRLRRDLAALPSTAVREVSCLGRCDQAPAAAINGTAISLRDPAKIREWMQRLESIPLFAPGSPRRWRCDPYREPEERYGLLRELLENPSSAGSHVLTALKESGLRGMGGAG